MKLFKSILLGVYLAVFILIIGIPAAAAYFALSILLALLEFVTSAADKVRDAIDDIMTTMCEVLEDWLP